MTLNIQKPQNNLLKGVATKEVHGEPLLNFYGEKETKDNFESSSGGIQSPMAKDKPISIEK